MSKELNLEFRVYEGPSLLASFAAVVADFTNPFASPLPTARFASRLTDILPSALMQAIALPTGDVAFAHAVALLTNALHDLAGPCELPVKVQYTDAGTARIVLGFYDPQAAMQACRSALRMPMRCLRLKPAALSARRPWRPRFDKPQG